VSVVWWGGGARWKTPGGGFCRSVGRLRGVLSDSLVLIRAANVGGVGGASGYADFPRSWTITSLSLQPPKPASKPRPDRSPRKGGCPRRSPQLVCSRPTPPRQKPCKTHPTRLPWVLSPPPNPYPRFVAFIRRTVGSAPGPKHQLVAWSRAAQDLPLGLIVIDLCRPR